MACSFGICCGSGTVWEWSFSFLIISGLRLIVSVVPLGWCSVIVVWSDEYV